MSLTLVFTKSSMMKGTILLFSFSLLEYSSSYPRRHKIAKNIRHVTSAKNHPCMASRDVKVTTSQILLYLKHLEYIQQDIQDTQLQLTEMMGQMSTGSKRNFTIFNLSALCGAEILYDTSLVLGYFRDELMGIAEMFKILQAKKLLEKDHQLTILLFRIINNLRGTVLVLWPTANDKFENKEGVRKLKIKRTSTVKVFRKCFKIITDLKHFIKTSLTIFNLSGYCPA